MRSLRDDFYCSPRCGQPQIKDLIQRFEARATSGGGEVVETEEWGFRVLSYHFKGKWRGYYARLDYISDAAAMNEVERNHQLQDTVLRYLSVPVEPKTEARGVSYAES
jgi:small subunit ribosomal protein S6